MFNSQTPVLRMTENGYLRQVQVSYKETYTEGGSGENIFLAPVWHRGKYNRLCHFTADS